MHTKKKLCKTIAFFWLIAIYSGNVFIPVPVRASNNGPIAPEAVAFEPVDATDMVNLSSGDFAYVLPLLNIPGPEGSFPVSLSYHAGITMEQEASWVGLGWNINTGSITRGINATPDDWNGGRSLDFISFEKSEHYYNVDVSVGIGKGVDVGLGLAWGSNKGLTGSVFAEAFMARVSFDTEGNIGLGVASGFDKNSVFGGSMKGNLKINISTASGKISTTGGLGIGFSSNGDILAIGNRSNEKTTRFPGGVSLSRSNFSHGDYQISTYGFYLPIKIGPIGVGFGYQKVTYTLRKAYPKTGYGILYAGNANAIKNQPLDNEFLDYQDRYTYLDMYEQPLPTYAEEFVGDSREIREKNNFSFAGYDSYDVNAFGLSGTLRPYLIQNATLFGLGFKGKDNKNNDLNIYYHNDKGENTSNKKFGSTQPSSDNLYFYFNGQFASSKSAKYWMWNRTNKKTMSQFLGGLWTLKRPEIMATIKSAYVSDIDPIYKDSRAYMGNFVEVFTNKQIANDKVPGFIPPKGLSNSKRKYNPSEFPPDGIGGYRITALDGKVYHFSLPVYQYEEVQRNTLTNDPDERKISEKRMYTPYAVHWMLTAITGPDYVKRWIWRNGKRNGKAYPDVRDYGYWIRFDYGQWSNGYTWRTPYNGKKYNTNNEGKVGESDNGYYIFGRKDLYYLDQITTRTHTALFVKNTRYDAQGKGLTYKYGNSFSDNNYTVKEENVTYPQEKALRLDKIILVKNEALRNFAKNNPYENIASPATVNVNWNTPELKNLKLRLHQQQAVIDVGDIPPSLIGDHALSVIDFTHNYKLATGTPNSFAPAESGSNGKGRLTLKQVGFLGKNGKSYIPSYKFSYHGEYDRMGNNYLADMQKEDLSSEEIYTAELKQQDEWGFRKKNIHYWSLRSITLPLGAKITVEHEEDRFYTEAFARRYFYNEMALRILKTRSGRNYIEFSNPEGSINKVNFTKYFDQEKDVIVDMFACRSECKKFGGDDYHYFVVKKKNLTIKAIDENYIQLWVPDHNGNDVIIVDESVTMGEDHYLYEGNRHSWGYTCGCPSGNTNNLFTFSHKFLANIDLENEDGGGLRTRSITVTDETGKKYITEYDYNDPQRNRTSGITSYAPVNGMKYIAYQSELPGPGTMYEWVTMLTKNEAGEVLSKTRYHFYTLQQADNIFDKNMRIQDKGIDLFKASVDDKGLIDNTFGKVYAKDIHVNVNTSLIGNLISIEQLNRKDEVLSKSINHYISGKNNQGKAFTKESFQSMKTLVGSIQDPSNENNYLNKLRLLNVSSRSDYSSMLSGSTSIAGGHKTTVEYKNFDPRTGVFTETIQTDSRGRVLRSKTIPAYAKYSEMGSKVDDIANKNMLTQKAAVYSWITDVGSNTEKPLFASITTWNGHWRYSDYLGHFPIHLPVWRKQSNYIWQGAVNSDGTLETQPTPFPWNNPPEPIASGSTGWQRISKIEKYNRYSLALESRDINNNYISTKTDANAERVLIAGNAAYYTMYYSGAEDHSVDNYFRGEFGGEIGQGGGIFSAKAHTGNWSLQLEPGREGGYQVGAHSHYTGNYRVSLWAHKSSHQHVRLLNGNTPVPLNTDERVVAGDWVQLNYSFRAAAGTRVSVNAQGGTVWVDDFRMHPISSNVQSYVYNDWGELSHILDANNMATHYIYDEAGRLTEVRSEIADRPEKTGGFKKSAEYAYNHVSKYDRLTCSLNYNCSTSERKHWCDFSPPYVILHISKNVTFHALVSGGSGDYSIQWTSPVSLSGTSINIPLLDELVDIRNCQIIKGPEIIIAYNVTDNITGETKSFSRVYSSFTSCSRLERIDYPR